MPQDPPYAPHNVAQYHRDNANNYSMQNRGSGSPSTGSSSIFGSFSGSGWNTSNRASGTTSRVEHTPPPPLNTYRNADGTFSPAMGYVWDDPAKLTVRLRTGLVRNADGTFRPAKGYVWDDSANLTVKLMRGLHLNEAG